MSKLRSDQMSKRQANHSFIGDVAQLLLFLLIAVVTQSATAEELKISIGSTSNLGVLPLIAKHEGVFQAQGLNVEYKKFQTGKMTMDALLAGEIEIGTLVKKKWKKKWCGEEMGEEMGYPHFNN